VTIGIPGAALRVPEVVEKLERILWRVSVGPFVLFMSGVWKAIDTTQVACYHLGL
jgi:hypothetical protein